MIQFDSNEHLILDKKSGDRSRQQNVVDTQTNLAQNNLNNLRNEMIPASQTAYNNYQNASGRTFSDYEDIMGQYKNAMGNMGVGPTNIEADLVNYTRSPELAHALSGYGEFADTGGFSPEAIRDLRARGISPIRAAYGNALNDMERRVNLAGGYSPNVGVLRAKMAREQGQQMADAAQNVNAQLQYMIQQGRLAGLGGLGDLSVKDIGFGQQAQLANQAAKLQAAGLNSSNINAANANRNALLSGMSSLYSATPGLLSTTGSQLAQQQGNRMGVEGMQQNLGQMKIGGQQGVAQMPTGFQSFLNNAGRISSIASNIASIPFGGGTGLLSSSRVPGMGGTYNQFPGGGMSSHNVYY
jgi:hypothetical protein